MCGLLCSISQNCFAQIVPRSWGVMLFKIWHYVHFMTQVKSHFIVCVRLWILQCLLWRWGYCQGLKHWEGSGASPTVPPLGIIYAGFFSAYTPYQQRTVWRRHAFVNTHIFLFVPMCNNSLNRWTWFTFNYFMLWYTVIWG